MATINQHRAKDGSITYRVRIRIKGQPIQTASFSTREDAVTWSKIREGEVLSGKHFPSKKANHTLAELIERYTADALPRKRYETQRREGYLLAFWVKRLGMKCLTDITKADIVKIRDEFVKRGAKSTTIHRYLNILSHMLNTAIREYDWLDSNAVALVSKPALPPGKTRYLSDEERQRLLVECRRSKNPLLYDLVLLAMYTGLRRGNLLRLRRRDIDLDQRTISVARTKNDMPVVLPLVGAAYDAIKARCSSLAEDEYLFPHANEDMPARSYCRAFDYARKRAKIEGASFHTLRHCVGSYLVQAGVDLYTVSRILNHKSIVMSQRYSHLHTDQLRDALEVLAQRLSQ
jgi:integrase